ncbi:hypothetical protein I3843_01G078600, partial [Carya illinoinensis]
MGLNETYAHLWSQILPSDPFPQIKKVFSLIIQEEKQREIVYESLPFNEYVAMLSNCDSNRGSTSSRSGKTFVTQKDQPYCTHYGLSGHTIDKCYKIHEYP